MRSLSGLLILLVLAGCAFDENDQEVEEQPIQFRFSIPADSTRGYYEADGVDLLIRFRRIPRAEGITTNRLVPAPPDPGVFRLGSEGSREIRWEDVVLDPDVSAYQWLVDGPNFLEPVWLHFYTGDGPGFDGGLGGRITIARPRTDAEGGMLFVLDDDADADFVNANTETMLGRPVFAVEPIGTFVASPDPGERGGHPFFVENLPRNGAFVLVAIVDSDGDGRYEPGQDWWGYPRSIDAPNLPIVYDVPDDPFGGPTIEFQIVSPGTLEPPSL